jgi:diadenylate cyclase
LKVLSAWLNELSITGWTSVVSTLLDVFLVALAIYWLIMLSKRTRAWQIIVGLALLLVLAYVTDKLRLHTLNWVLRSLLPLGPVALVILFYPELRSTLEGMGRVTGWGRGLASLAKEENSHVIQSVALATAWMSAQKIGALIVLERDTALDDIAATGTMMDALVSQNLICATFYPGNPLHDGAIIIRGAHILAAGCTLPLTESDVGAMVHTRHKAALGVSESRDAVAVVVSEETGTISLAVDGRLLRGLTEETLAKRLHLLMGYSDGTMRRSDLAKKVNGTLRKARIKHK